MQWPTNGTTYSLFSLGSLFFYDNAIEFRDPLEGTLEW
jgi:hypothetical protein